MGDLNLAGVTFLSDEYGSHMDGAISDCSEILFDFFSANSSL